MKIREKTGKSHQLVPPFFDRTILDGIFPRKYNINNYMHIQIPRKRFTLRMTSLPGILRGGERSCCHGKTRTGGPFPPGDDDGRLALVRRPPCQKAGQRWLDVPGLGPPCGGGVRRGRLQRLGGGSGPLARKGEIWEGFLPDLPVYTSYKYAVRGRTARSARRRTPTASTQRPGRRQPASCMTSADSSGRTALSGRRRPSTRSIHHR